MQLVISSKTSCVFTSDNWRQMKIDFITDPSFTLSRISLF